MAEPIRKLGPYTLVRKIGRGGFGVVWLAEKRTAIATTQFALKLPRGEDIDLEAFKQEASIWIQASGHPNVLPLIDADIYDEQVMIVSEYVPDGSLAGWIKEHGGQVPSAAAACEIMDGVLSGLGHLHARRIIHRDLKPENILLQRETPRLADFGIARLLKSSSHSTHISGTLAYMAPEAFDGKRTEQTDVWSVGVIFYEMLAGRLPYDQPDIPSFIGAIVRNDPPPLPSTVPEVLRAIVFKALQRDPNQRYLTAADMRTDLREAEHRVWLEGRPTIVEKTPPATVPRVEILTDPSPQTKPQPTLPIVPPTETLPFVPATTVQLDAANVPAGDRDRKPRPLLWSLAAVAILLIFIGVPLAITIGLGLYRTLAPAKKPIVKQTQGPYALKQTLTGYSKMVRSVAFSPDGATLASGAEDSAIKLWSAQTGALKQTMTATGAVYVVAFSPDGFTVAGSYSDKAVRLWNVSNGTLRRTLAGHTGAIWSIAFSPDGKTVASASEDNTVKLWDADTGTLKQTLMGHSNWVRSVAFSPDGATLASGSDDHTIRLWDLKTGTTKLTLTGHTNFVMVVTFSPDGLTLASGSEDKTIKLWDVQSGVLRQTLTGHTDWVWCLAFSADGNTLASASADDSVRLWNARTGALSQSLPAHSSAVFSVAFSPDGRTMSTASSDQTVKLWQGP